MYPSDDTKAPKIAILCFFAPKMHLFENFISSKLLVLQRCFTLQNDGNMNFSTVFPYSITLETIPRPCFLSLKCPLSEN